MSANHFSLLWGKILDSSLWIIESKETRLVWITLLAMKNMDGIVKSSVVGLASRAKVSVEECRLALEVLKNRDPEDTSGVEEGRRIRDIPGGWEIVNNEAYQFYTEAQRLKWRERKRMEKERKQAQIAKIGERSIPAVPAVPPQILPVQERLSPPPVLEPEKPAATPLITLPATATIEEAMAAIARVTGQALGVQPPVKPTVAVVNYPALADVNPPETETASPAPSKPKAKDPLTEQAKVIIQELNDLTGRNFRAVDADLVSICARLRESGVTFEGVLQMVRRQVKCWLGDERMAAFLRPGTLFQPSKFNSYYANKDQAIPNLQREHKPNPRNAGMGVKPGEGGAAAVRELQERGDLA